MPQQHPKLQSELAKAQGKSKVQRHARSWAVRILYRQGLQVPAKRNVPRKTEQRTMSSLRTTRKTGEGPQYNGLPDRGTPILPPSKFSLIGFLRPPQPQRLLQAQQISQQIPQKTQQIPQSQQLSQTQFPQTPQQILITRSFEPSIDIQEREKDELITANPLQRPLGRVTTTMAQSTLGKTHDPLDLKSP